MRWRNRILPLAPPQPPGAPPALCACALRSACIELGAAVETCIQRPSDSPAMYRVAGGRPLPKPSFKAVSTISAWFYRQNDAAGVCRHCVPGSSEVSAGVKIQTERFGRRNNPPLPLMQVMTAAARKPDFPGLSQLHVSRKDEAVLPKDSLMAADAPLGPYNQPEMSINMKKKSLIPLPHTAPQLSLPAL